MTMSRCLGSVNFTAKAAVTKSALSASPRSTASLIIVTIAAAWISDNRPTLGEAAWSAMRSLADPIRAFIDRKFDIASPTRDN